MTAQFRKGRMRPGAFGNLRPRKAYDFGVSMTDQPTAQPTNTGTVGEPNASLSVVFAGGGCRAFWSLGVWSALQQEIPNVREWAGVSAGSAMAIASATGTAEPVVDGFVRRTGENKRNLYFGRLFGSGRAFPHEEIYRATIREFLTDDVLTTLQAASPVRILHAYVEPGRSVTRTVFGALMAYRNRRKLHGVHGPDTPPPGIGEEVVTAQDARDAQQIVDHVMSSSASPPVTATPKRDGRVYFDGSLVDNVPVRALSEAARSGPTLVLLTRPTEIAHRPNSDTRLYLAPESPVPVHKWDYTSPDLIAKTFELGAEDGRRHLDEVRRFLDRTAG